MFITALSIINSSSSYQIAKLSYKVFQRSCLLLLINTNLKEIIILKSFLNDSSEYISNNSNNGSSYFCRNRKVKKVKSSMAKSLPVENLLPQNVGSIINYLQLLLKQPNGELLVAVNHNQVRTMASETVDPIDCSHPPPYTGHELHIV